MRDECLRNSACVVAVCNRCLPHLHYTVCGGRIDYSRGPFLFLAVNSPEWQEKGDVHGKWGSGCYFSSSGTLRAWYSDCATGWKAPGSSPDRGKIFFCSPKHPDRLWDLSSLLFNGLGVSGALPLLPLYASMARIGKTFTSRVKLTSVRLPYTTVL